jgi:hypothetical protein
MFKLESIIIDLNTSPFDGEVDLWNVVSIELFFSALLFNFIIEALILLLQSNNATERKIIEQLQNVRVCILNFFFFFTFFGMPHLATFIFNFSLMSWLANCLHPSSIQCRGLNLQPLGHEPSALTTRPRLLAFLEFHIFS